MFDFSSAYDGDFRLGFLSVFRSGKTVNNALGASLFLAQISFVIKHGLQLIQKNGGIYQTINYDYLSDCFKDIKKKDIIQDSIDAINQALQKYDERDFRQAGIILGKLADELCPLLKYDIF
mmetsp:Transcript_40312/g.29727  ORF Transcript_40312/g.29727 Transcript_40312/m.29727 type:complete len:121 (+) Transcript_40312:610-972(+)